MPIHSHLVTIGSIITLILASTATTSIVYGQTTIPKAQNVPTSPASPPSHAPSPKPHMVEIVSPSKGEQVLVGKAFLISGTSAGNTLHFLKHAAWYLLTNLTYLDSQ